MFINVCTSCGALFEWEERSDRRAPDCPKCGFSLDEPNPAKHALPKGPALLVGSLDSGYARRMTAAVGVLLLGALVFFGSFPLELWPGLLVGLALAGVGGWLVWATEQGEKQRSREALAAVDLANQASAPAPPPVPPRNEPASAVAAPPASAPAATGGPGFRSTFVSVAEIERIDREMGELYLHCPHCAEEERINDVGKLMLKQGNNVFAAYPCKKCGIVFDGAQHMRKLDPVPARGEGSTSEAAGLAARPGPAPAGGAIDLEDFAILIFGPFAEKWPAALRSQGVQGQMIVRQRLDELAWPARQVRGMTLIFAHCIPSRKGQGKSEQDMREWAAQLLGGAGFTASAFHHPDLRWYGGKADDQVDLKLFWEGLDSQEALRIARALERSFLSADGAASYR